MAPRDESRHRESSSHRKHEHGKKSSRDRSSRRPLTDSEATSSGTPSSTGQKLSLNALAQLNDHNVAHPSADPPAPERVRRKKERRPREDDYIIVELEGESPRVEKRRRKHEYTDAEKEARRADRRERRRREAVTDNEQELPAAKREKIRREVVTDTEKDYETPRRERRRKEAVTDSERDYETPKRDRGRKEAAADPDSVSKKDRHLISTDPEDEDALRWRRFKSRENHKKRLVSGAIVEEGRAWGKLRGGTGSKHSSYDSLAAEKEEAYQKVRPPANKKKRRCEFQPSSYPVLHH